MMQVAASPQPVAPQITDEHLAMFAKLRIDRKLLADAGICSVTDAQARDCGQFGQSQISDFSGIIFQYFDPETGHRVTTRLRRTTQIDANGKVQRKYVSPWGDNRHLYFSPGAASLLAEVTVPVVLVEAEKSSLALTALAARTERRILPIATGGCWGWRGKVGVGPIPKETGRKCEARYRTSTELLGRAALRSSSSTQTSRPIRCTSCSSCARTGTGIPRRIGKDSRYPPSRRRQRPRRSSLRVR